MKDAIHELISKIIALLAAVRYEDIFNLTGGVRMSIHEIQTAINDYGRTIVLPPDSAYSLLDIVAVKNVPFDQYSVRMPLWTKEEGRSDLTLEVTCKFFEEREEVELDDIRVL
jgi:hypothetical protein